MGQKPSKMAKNSFFLFFEGGAFEPVASPLDPPLISNSVGTVPIFKFSPGLGTEASIPRFQRTGSGTSILVPTSQYQGFGTQGFQGLFVFFQFNTILVPL